MRLNKPFFILILSLSTMVACQNSQHEYAHLFEDKEQVDSTAEDDSELIDDILFTKAACVKATSTQLSQVNLGNTKKQSFLDSCGKSTGGSPWCQQLIRPNPSSISSFRCTYGETQVHQLIHPDSTTWKNAYQAVNLVERLENLGVKVCQIYNWWRPEPYNKNVGGAAGRHPFGTSVDVRFCSKEDQAKAHSQLCKWRKQGELRALGYYSSSSLHFGVGDSAANTWGKSCP